MRIIITGGTGLLGRPLSAALAGEGHEVIVLTRNPDKVKDMPAGVQLHAWDAESMAGWGHLADGAFAIINYAGEGIGDGRWSAERKQKIRQSRTKAGKAVIDGKEFPLGDGSAVVVPAGARHNIINTSADKELKLYTIYSPPNHPDGTIHKTKAEAEAAEKGRH